MYFFTRRRDRGCPVGFFIDFIRRIFEQHVPFPVAVRIYLRHILVQLSSESAATITRYDVIYSTKSSHFSPFLGEQKHKMSTNAATFHYVI